MKKNEKEFLAAESGTALTVRAIPSKTKLGIGKKNKGGYIDFYVPWISTKSEREDRIIKEFQKLTGVKDSKIEIISGKNDSFIIMIIGLNSETLNQIVDRI